jgi:hypothetical protein
MKTKVITLSVMVPADEAETILSDMIKTTNLDSPRHVLENTIRDPQRWEEQESAEDFQE